MIRLFIIDLEVYPDPKCNQEVDIDSKTSFTLETSNPALWDYSGGITSTFSYSIKLPRTVNNDGIFSTYEPNINKRFGLCPVRVWVDGVEVLNDAVVGSIAWGVSDITITISTEKFMKLKDLNVKLKDLDFNNEVGSYIIDNGNRWWDNVTFAPLSFNNEATAEFDNDIEVEMGNPAVALWYLNDKVREVSGINFYTFLDNNNYYMLCKKPKERYDILSCNDSFKWKFSGSRSVFAPIPSGSNDSFNVSVTNFTALRDGKLNSNDLKVKFSGAKTYPSRLDVHVKVFLIHVDGKSTVFNSKFSNVVFSNNVSGEYGIEFNDVEILKGNMYRFDIEVIGTNVGGGANYPLDVISEKWGNAFNNYFAPTFYICDCLPDVTLIDYIKSILIYNDDFLNFGANGGVIVESRAEWLTPSTTIDWTDKIIKIESVSDDIFGWSKEILFEYKEDDDKSLERIKDNNFKRPVNYRVDKKETTTVFKSVFSSYPTNKKYVTHIDHKPTSAGNKLMRSFYKKGDGWVAEFDTQFQSYIESMKLDAILTNPLTVQATILFNALDFLNFDFRSKVFVQQLNSHFIVHKIQWTEKTAKVTLIKIQ